MENRYLNSVMTRPILDSLLWRRYKAYYIEKDGQVIWQDNAPKEAIQSYEYYCRQLEQLANFTKPTSPVWHQWFSSKPHSAKRDEGLGLAQRYLEKRWPDNARFIKAKRIDRQVIIFWADGPTHYISVIHFKDGRPNQESRYIKTKGHI